MKKLANSGVSVIRPILVLGLPTHLYSRQKRDLIAIVKTHIDVADKGATDMWLAGVPIEEIQLLCGHDDKSTTEIYVKQRWRKTAAPNMIKIAG